MTFSEPLGGVSVTAAPNEATNLQHPWSLPKLKSLVIGQGISLLITGTGVFSSFLAEGGIDLPVTQSSLNYVLLTAHLFWALPHARRSGLAVPAWRYALWALCDVEANFLVVWAYQYTSVASVMLLDCFGIPSAMVLSCLFLRARYSLAHVAAVFVCIAGMALTVASDIASGKTGNSIQGQSAWFGDVLVLCGAALYSLSNVLQEWLLKSCNQRCEALGMLGLFGTVFSCGQALVLERHALAETSWSPWTVFCLLGFQLCLFCMYVLTSTFLQNSDAALFNLSLLTSDLYSVVFSWKVLHHKVTWMYCGAFATTLSGLVLYHTRPVVSFFRNTATSSSGSCLLES